MTTRAKADQSKPLILASGSKSRASLLKGAGLEFQIVPAMVDESGVKSALQAEGATAAQCAETLGELKAVKVSQTKPGALVVGADQLLECDGAWFDKPADTDGARKHLQTLRGRQHVLATSVVVALDGARIWHHNAAPRLTMRAFSDAFLEDYLLQVGENVLSSVGAYQLEGRGIQLFNRIDGDYFSILGLPLLELLSFLRGHNVVPT
ncbi:MAG: Maf family protein [Rhodospirillaceae bacterium]